MSNYYYKGVNLNNIYVNDGKTTSDATTNGYIGIPNSNSNEGIKYPGEAPVSFGFKYKGTDLSKTCTANTTTYTSSTNASIPTGCKSIRVISVGGGGAGGGAGGNAEATAISGGNTAKGNGGAGLNGGYGSITYSNNNTAANYNIENANSIYVTVGTSGNLGNNGTDNYVSATLFDNSESTTGGVGGAGNAGNASYLTITTNNGTNNVFEASPGNGGAGGNGAYAFVDAPDQKTTSNKGNSNTDYANLQNDPYSSKVYPELIFQKIKFGNETINIPYGYPGTGSYYNEKTLYPGSTGLPGVVKIIWLYD